MSTAAAEIQLDLFGAPELEPAPVVTEARPCGTCGGRGTYNKFLTGASGVMDRYPTLVTCPDCCGLKVRTVSVKPACPQSAKSAGTEMGSVTAMTDFSRAMKAAGYGLKVTTGGDLDVRKAKQCCNALLRGVASDKPEPKVADWESAQVELATLTGGMPWLFAHVADDPDPGACARRVAAVEATAAAEKARAKK